MPNKWVEHVRAYAKANNLSYSCAMTETGCKESYRKKYPKPVTGKKRRANALGDKIKQGMEMSGMSAEDVPAPAGPKKAKKSNVNRQRVIKAIASKMRKIGAEIMGMSAEDKDAPAGPKKRKLKTTIEKRMRILRALAVKMRKLKAESASVIGTPLKAPLAPVEYDTPDEVSDDEEEMEVEVIKYKGVEYLKDSLNNVYLYTSVAKEEGVDDDDIIGKWDSKTKTIVFLKGKEKEAEPKSELQTATDFLAKVVPFTYKTPAEKEKIAYAEDVVDRLSSKPKAQFLMDRPFALVKQFLGIKGADPFNALKTRTDVAVFFWVLGVLIGDGRPADSIERPYFLGEYKDSEYLQLYDYSDLPYKKQYDGEYITKSFDRVNKVINHFLTPSNWEAIAYRSAGAMRRHSASVSINWKGEGKKPRGEDARTKSWDEDKKKYLLPVWEEREKLATKYLAQITADDDRHKTSRSAIRSAVADKINLTLSNSGLINVYRALRKEIKSPVSIPNSWHTKEKAGLYGDLVTHLKKLKQPSNLKRFNEMIAEATIAEEAKNDLAWKKEQARMNKKSRQSEGPLRAPPTEQEWKDKSF